MTVLTHCWETFFILFLILGCWTQLYLYSKNVLEMYSVSFQSSKHKCFMGSSVQPLTVKLFSTQNVRPSSFYSILYFSLFFFFFRLPSSNLFEILSQAKHHHLLKIAETIIRINKAKHPSHRFISFGV